MMIVFWILLVLIIGLILWIVLVPLQVKVNTDLGQYQISQSGTVKIAFHPWQRPALDMWLFGFRIDTTTKEKTVRESPASDTKKKSTIKRSLSAWLYLFQGIYHSFKLKSLVCAIDLDDPVMNARMVPLVHLLNRGVVSLSTNFVNRNFLYVNIRVSVSRILWTTFRFYIKK